MYQELVRECQRLSVDLEEFHCQFPPMERTQRRHPLTSAVVKPSSTAARPGMLPAPRYSPDPMRLLPPPADKRDTPGLRTSPAPVADLSKATCFHYGEVGHFVSSCKNPRKSPGINEIEHEYEALGDDEANDEADTDSESEN